jgi:hypothetical protein
MIKIKMKLQPQSLTELLKLFSSLKTVLNIGMRGMLLNMVKCKCCGIGEIEEYGHFDICDICNWESDSVQENKPDFSGGANVMSLNEARIAFKNGEKIP